MLDHLTVDRLRVLAGINSAEFWAAASPRDRRWPDAWAADMGLAEPMCNSTTLLAPLTDTGAADLTARLDDFYGQMSGAGWLLWSPWPTPDLRPLGYSSAGHPPLLVRAAEAPPVAIPYGLRIEEITDPESLRAYWQGLVDWYPLAALAGTDAVSVFEARMLGKNHRYWIGFENDQPVTIAMAVVGDDLIGVYAVATSATARGKGYGGAVTDVAARCVPHLPAYLKSSDLGFPVYQRIGFEKVDQFSLWYRDRLPPANR